MTDALPETTKPDSMRIEKRGISFFVAKGNNDEFWKLVSDDIWEPETFRIFERFIDKTCVYLDIGCWIGPTALYAAQLAKHTYAFEPDPVAFEILSENLARNADAAWAPRLEVSKAAIARDEGTIQIGSRTSGGDSTSSSLFAELATHWSVPAITLESLMRDKALWEERIFIKIDIEGGEYELIPSIGDVLGRCNVVLFLSLHPGFLNASLSPGTSLLSRLWRRFRFTMCHAKLLRSLPFKRYMRLDGSWLSAWRMMLDCAFRGKVPTEILAYNVEYISHVEAHANR